MQPAVFLDRDNTLILNDGDLGNPDEVRIAEGVPAGLRSLRKAGFRLVVVTNQAGVARGKFTEDDVDAVHQRIAVEVDAAAGASGLIDRFYYCPYHLEATVAEYRRDHPWRKPNPGMILQAARDMGLDLSRSWMIGDQERDIVAGRAAGCRTILVTRDSRLAHRCGPTEVAGNFEEAVQIVLRQSPIVSANALNMNGPAAAPQALHAAAAHGSHEAGAAAGAGSNDPNTLRRAITELTEEIRADRLRRAEFTVARLAAGVFQLLAILLAVLGLMQLDNLEVFAKWMVGALLVQLLTITALVMDLKS